MKFPLTREYLQNYDVQTEYDNNKIEECLIRLRDDIIGKFGPPGNNNFTEKSFTIQFSNRPYVYIRDRLLSRFIEKLKENFIGCDIIIDPLKTYLIIDWS